MDNKLVLSRGRDPYSEWTPMQIQRAMWVATYFTHMNRRTHLRGFHYWLVSQSPRPKWPDGLIYSNDESSWEKLCAACVWARYTHIGDWDNLIDRKHPDAIDHTDYAHYNPDPQYAPTVITADELHDILMRGAPRFSTTGLSTYHLEVWVEKASMNEIIMPPIRRYGAVLQALVGEASLERATLALARIERTGKPARIFYISDFDPAGQQMPVSVARKLEFYARECDMDIRLQLLALTESQVKLYKLPGIPTKTTDSRAASFIDRYGDRATELDALEALHPGTLRHLVTEALAPYVDESKLKAIEAENARLRRAYSHIINDLSLADAVQDLKDITTTIYHTGQKLLGNFDYPLASHQATEDDHELLNTLRSYDDQLAAYRNYRGK